jgi:tRNA-Thr(GGU) m(6)t(6)A37 methyltransferase TsaA
MSIRTRIRTLLGGGKSLFPLEPVHYQPVGVVRNRIREPRLSGWQDVRSDIILREELAPALDGLDGFSHVIVVFHLDRVLPDEDRAVSARIGGEAGPTVGTFASRHPRRPNAIAVSTCQVVHRRQNVLRVKGLDALDGSPVLDLKPYLPPYDSVPDAKLPPWALEPPG